MKRFLPKALLFVFFILSTTFISACPFCNPQIKDAIYNSTFYPNVFTMVSAFMALGLVVTLLTYFSVRKHKAYTVNHPAGSHLSPVPLTTAAMVLGIGFGGFIDGIVLHQILQWHEMLSNKIAATNYVGKSVNMFWDGIFHFFTLLVTFTGILLLYRLLHRNDINRSGYLLSGGLLTGWGLFNIIEGIIDHQILQLHNVKELTDEPQVYNLAFLGFSLVLLLAGYWLTKTGNLKPR